MVAAAPPTYSGARHATVSVLQAWACGAGGGDFAEAPFALMWLRMRMPWPYNHGAFGVKLRQVVAGALQLAVVSNYMIDFRWLVSACPALLSARQLVVLHGDSPNQMRGAVAEARVPGSCRVRPRPPSSPCMQAMHVARAAARSAAQLF